MMNRLKRYFITGILVILPLFLSLYVLFIVFRFFDGILGPLINIYFKQNFQVYIPGVGLILFILIVFLTGFFSTHVIGKGFHLFVEKAVSRFPLLRYIYPSIKRAFEFLFSEASLSFKKAVLVEYPSKGIWSIAFVTNENFYEANKKTNQDLLTVYVPSVPNPATGFIVLVPRSAVVYLDITVTDAMKIIISGGLLNPDALPAGKKEKG
jgi:uncharacterized membrane protein